MLYQLRMSLDELQLASIWMKTAAAYFKVLFQYSLSATTKVSVEISGLRMFQTGNLHITTHNHYQEGKCSLMW
jgi:hypothetical protein